jgi:hypothetical protein
MEKQYYTPKIEEFHPNFRYEVHWGDGNYIKNTFGVRGATIIGIENVINNDLVRVKSLDHEDIIEAGWEQIDEDPNNIQFFKLRNFILHIESGRVLISIVGSIGLFRGRVKNYNEFIKLMDMLGIKKEAPTKEELAEDSWFERNGLV